MHWSGTYSASCRATLLCEHAMRSSGSSILRNMFVHASISAARSVRTEHDPRHQRPVHEDQGHWSLCFLPLCSYAHTAARRELHPLQGQSSVQAHAHTVPLPRVRPSQLHSPLSLYKGSACCCPTASASPSLAQTGVWTCRPSTSSSIAWTRWRSSPMRSPVHCFFALQSRTVD